jgi:DNA (cytosine-5)-methyltransferase 1
MLNGLDLFSGIGGLSLALRKWVKPIAYCEIDPFCQAVLLSRMATKNVEQAPIWDDIRTFKCPILRERIDIIYGGFPCQDISVAGRGEGLEGKRSGLFFEVARLTRELRPQFVFLENVLGLLSISSGTVFGTILSDLDKAGFNAEWQVLSAADVGACHNRRRIWCIAHSHNL